MKKRRHHSQAVRSRNRAWRELSLKIRNEKKCCEWCGSDKRLQVHHIIPKKSHPSLWLDENDLVCLCSRCHWLVHHTHFWEFVAWLREAKPKQFDYVMDVSKNYIPNSHRR